MLVVYLMCADCFCGLGFGVVGCLCAVNECVQIVITFFTSVIDVLLLLCG